MEWTDEALVLGLHGGRLHVVVGLGELVHLLGELGVQALELIRRITQDLALALCGIDPGTGPDHLLGLRHDLGFHLVVAGEVDQTCNGRRQRLTPGCVVWYHEDEWVEGRVLQAPWIYYSVNFAASTLGPPDFEHRLRPGLAGLQERFAALHAAWDATASGEREWRGQSHLLALLADIGAHPGGGVTGAPGHNAARAILRDHRALFARR